MPNPRDEIGEWYRRLQREADRLADELAAARKVAKSCEPCCGTGTLLVRDHLGDCVHDMCDGCVGARADVRRLDAALERARYVGD